MLQFLEDHLHNQRNALFGWCQRGNHHDPSSDEESSEQSKTVIYFLGDCKLKWTISGQNV